MTAAEAGPYRAGDSTPRFICGVRFDSVSVGAAGVCRVCKVPRLPLDDEQVLVEVRSRAAQLFRKRQNRRWVPVIVLGAILTLGLYVLCGVGGWIDIRPHSSAGNMRFQIVHPAFFFILFAVAVPLGLFFRRRWSDAGDPATLPLAELLEWLGVVTDE